MSMSSGRFGCHGRGDEFSSFGVSRRHVVSEKLDEFRAPEAETHRNSRAKDGTHTGYCMRYGQEMDWYAPINNDLSIRANTHNGMDTQTNVFSEQNPLKSDVFAMY